MNNKCIFCEIVNKVENSYIIYENSNLIVILDADPINEGHVLIITKKHYLDLDEIPESIINDIFHISGKIIKSLKQVYQLDGYSIMQNGGYFNDIGHFHLHIFPRYKNDGFGWNSSDIKLEVSKQVCDKLKKALEDKKE